jgi:hypothetical protein
MPMSEHLRVQHPPFGAAMMCDKMCRDMMVAVSA